MQWNTFLGGSSGDYSMAIAVDGSGNVYVAGYSNSAWGSPVRSYTSGYDAFVAKLDGNGSLTWNTFLGGSGDDYAFAIALGSGSNIYVAARSTATWGSPVRSYTSGYDAFVVKLWTSDTYADPAGVCEQNTVLHQH